MLSIRFARVGKTKQPTYRITVAEKGRDAYGRSLEILGHFNPRTDVCEVNAERIKYWISVGAKPSPRVYNLLVDQNVIAGPKIKISRSKKKKSEETKAVEPKAPTAVTEKQKPAAAKEEKKESAPKEEKKEPAAKKEEKPEPEAKK